MANNASSQFVWAARMALKVKWPPDVAKLRARFLAMEKAVELRVHAFVLEGDSQLVMRSLRHVQLAEACLLLSHCGGRVASKTLNGFVARRMGWLTMSPSGCYPIQSFSFT